MSQIALPLSLSGAAGPTRIVAGIGNAHVIEALNNTANWPFRTAVLSGPPRSGKSLLARWFVESGHGGHGGECVDNADSMDETELFHRWNRAQASGTPLLLVSNAQGEGWKIRLPDLASRVGAALHLEVGPPDDAMLADLIALHAEQRGLILDEAATSYLVPRCERSHLGVERLVMAIDRLSLERKQPPTMAIWRDALDEVAGGSQPRLP